jgi:diguanylate cyclase (GGDEF)-like protein/PAS domain S-box-containing protein
MNRPAGTVANRAWIAYLALGLVASTAYLFAPGLQGNGPLFNVISGSSAIAILLGLSLHRPVAPWVWRWFAIGQALFFLGDVYTYSYPLVSGDEVPFPSAGDALYLLVYPALMTGVLLAVRRRNPQGDRAGVIDALIITVGMALLSWVFLMAPYVHDATLSPLAKMVSIAYPLGDVLLLAATLRLAFDGGRRRGSFYLLIASVGALLATDAAYGFALLNGTYDHQLIYDAGWIAYYLLWGAAAMHPTMQDFVEATPDRERRLGWQRLGLLTVASLVAPAILLVREAGRGDVDLLVIVVASIVVFLFVIARVAGLVTQNERTVMRERALRLANLALVKATTPEEIASAALGTARALVAGVGEARVCVERPDGLVPMTAEQGGVHAALSRGAVTLLELAAILPNEPVTLPAAVHAELDLPADAQRANVFPLAARGERRGLLIAASATPLSPILVEALDALSASVSLALESAALIEQAHRRENEARFASLVRNASDVITVVDRDGRVLYQSPSIERILGFAADDVSATLFEDLVIPGDRGLLRKVLQTTGDGARSHAFDCTLSHRDGRALKFEIVATDLHDDEHVRGIVLNGRDVSERARFEEELAHQAFHDTVTGLPNRALFADRVEHALARAVREGTSIAVIFLDLDDFKTINDSLGHAAGDEVLKHVGARLQETVRATDTAARFGGDEFAILLEDVGDPATAIDLAERLVEGFEMPIAVVDKDLSVRASIGIALSGADAEQTPRDADELIRNADAAMYICKRDGKGGYRVFEAAMHERVLERLELRLELQRAIDEGQFELHFQPVVRLRDGRVAGMEALVRWHHPTRGLVQPGQFIPLAEEMGVIVDLGRWVTREACHQAAQLHASGEAGPDFTISVNLSVRQLQHPDVVADVRAALESSGIDPRVLVLEITESVMMADYQLARRRLGQLKDLGVRIAMDDFGTGYSSLSYLSRFPVDILKMDRSFLASDASPQAADLAAAIISLGESLKLEVVAEGIELPGQYDSLRELGCDLGQGFLIARPMDVDATRAWLADEAERAGRTEHDADAA